VAGLGDCPDVQPIPEQKSPMKRQKLLPQSLAMNLNHAATPLRVASGSETYSNTMAAPHEYFDLTSNVGFRSRSEMLVRDHGLPEGQSAIVGRHAVMDKHRKAVLAQSGNGVLEQAEVLKGPTTQAYPV
jgi:hypothetical protein